MECEHRIAHLELIGRAHETVVDAMYEQTFSLDNSRWFLLDTKLLVDD